MHFSHTISVLTVVVPFLLRSHASPLQPRQVSAGPTSCGPIVSALAGAATPFCSSYLGITTDRSYTVTEYRDTTITFNRTATSILGTQIVTGSGITYNVTLTAPPTVVTQTV